MWFAGAIALTLPALLLRGIGLHLNPGVEAPIYGVAILGAASLLTWAAEVAEKDISQALALAFLALIAVLPEYAVDLYLTWTAASQPEYAPYAIANMTGANRLLIGIGWPLIIFLYWFKTRAKTLHMPRSHGVEISFLALATLYSFAIPLIGNINLFDSLVLVSLFALYMWRAAKGEQEEPELVGPAATLGAFSTWRRRGVVAFLFVFAAAVILVSTEPFAESLLATGRLLEIDEFLLIQWIAPLASEAPEVSIAVILCLRLRQEAALRTVISAKVNQWTLLIGTIAVVYSFGLGRPGALPLDGRQVEEVLLTAAQSAFAVTVIANFRFSLAEASVLFVLFISQLLVPDPQIRYGFAALYLALAFALIVFRKGEAARGLGQVVVANLMGRWDPNLASGDPSDEQRPSDAEQG